MEHQENKKGKRKGLIITLSAHGLAILLFCLFGFTIINPPKGGAELAFGDINVGGDNSPNTAEVVDDRPTVAQPTAPDPVDPVSAQENFETQDQSEVAVDNSPNPVKKKPKETVKEVPEKTPEEIEAERLAKLRQEELDKFNSMYSSGEKKGDDNTGGKGSGDNPGTEGQNGLSDAPGSGNGAGGQFEVGGRKAIKPGDLNHNCGVSGKVKVWLKIDRSGTVVDAKATGGDTNPCLMRQAVEAALTTKYNARNDGPQFQEGFITIKFHLN